ncbi:MAG: c-type cytochrome [Magnetococcus sp. YQC-5]
MKTFLQVVLFSLFVVFCFTGYSNFGIPQITPAAPPVAEKVDLGAMTMDQFVAMGEKVVTGKGTCTLCHNDLGRAPMLNKLGANIKVNLEDPRYKGEAKGSAEKYLVESLVKPSAYVVAGFGKAGSNDTESPMPDVSGGSIALSQPEIMAVVAYLLDSNGLENTVQIPKDTKTGDAGDKKADAGPRKPYATADEIITAVNCGMCHKMPGQVGEVGPDLMQIGSKRDRDYLRRAILTPNSEIAEGFQPDMMPVDYGTQLYGSEVEMLVDYLVGLR